jgi:RNA polymerase sigma-70 factor (ECF subfamily)
MGGPERNVRRRIREARGGSADALGEVLQSYRPYLLLVARHELDPDLQAKGGASDLVQETFLEAQRDFGGFQGDSADEFRAWLRRLLLNNLANFTRRYRATDKRCVAREVPLQADSGSNPCAGGVSADLSSPSDQALRREQDGALQRALERLSEDHRRLLLLRYREGLSFEEIGALMQRSANAMRKLWARALERLQQEMQASE